MASAHRTSAAAALFVGALLGALFAAVGGAPPAAAGEGVEVWATTPARDRPESALVVGSTVFVGTTAGAEGLAVGDGKPSVIYGFDRSSGAVRHVIEVDGEDVWAFRGIAGMAADGLDRLYALDTQGRVLRFTVTGRGVHQETYATLPDLPPCLLGRGSGCSPTHDDRRPFPNDLAFTADGTLYVTDSWQATVWRIPPGGRPTPWFSDPRLDGVIGVNGIAVTPDRSSLVVGVTGDFTDVASVHRLPLVDAPTADDLRLLASWQSGGADGLAFGAGGDLFVSLFAQNGIVVVDPLGGELRRITSALFDEPARFAFDNRLGALLVPNHGFLNVRPEPRTVVRVAVGERGVPLPRPKLP